MASKSKLDLSAEDIEVLARELETCILKTRTESEIKKIKYDYWLNETDAEIYRKIHFIVTAQIAGHFEKFFDRQIDLYWDEQQQAIIDSRKRGPRGPRPKIEKDPKSKSVSTGKKLWGFEVETFE